MEAVTKRLETVRQQLAVGSSRLVGAQRLMAWAAVELREIIEQLETERVGREGKC